MQDDTSDESQDGNPEPTGPLPRIRKDGVEMTFWTSHPKRELVRAIAFAHNRTLRSLLNEALDGLIAKYGSSKS